MNSAEHEACVWKAFAESLRIVQKAKKISLSLKKASICFLVFIFMINVNNFRQLLFDTPLEISSSNFRDADVKRSYSTSLAWVTIPSF